MKKTAKAILIGLATTLLGMIIYFSITSYKSEAPHKMKFLIF